MKSKRSAARPLVAPLIDVASRLIDQALRANTPAEGAVLAAAAAACVRAAVAAETPIVLPQRSRPEPNADEEG